MWLWRKEWNSIKREKCMIEKSNAAKHGGKWDIIEKKEALPYTEEKSVKSSANAAIYTDKRREGV